VIAAAVALGSTVYTSHRFERVQQRVKLAAAGVMHKGRNVAAAACGSVVVGCVQVGTTCSRTQFKVYKYCISYMLYVTVEYYTITYGNVIEMRR
jgi:hypothetical protein